MGRSQCETLPGPLPGLGGCSGADTQKHLQAEPHTVPKAGLAVPTTKTKGPQLSLRASTSSVLLGWILHYPSLKPLPQPRSRQKVWCWGWDQVRADRNLSGMQAPLWVSTFEPFILGNIRSFNYSARDSFLMKTFLRRNSVGETGGHPEPLLQPLETKLCSISRALRASPGRWFQPCLGGRRF